MIALLHAEKKGENVPLRMDVALGPAKTPTDEEIAEDTARVNKKVMKDVLGSIGRVEREMTNLVAQIKELEALASSRLKVDA